MTTLSNRFHEAVAKINEAKPNLVLQQAKPLSNTAFSVTASHGTSRNQLTKADYIEMVAAATDNAFYLQPDTLVGLGNSGYNTVVAFIIEANTQSRPYDEADINANMRSVTANVFADNEDKIWRVVESGGIKHLVQSVNEDFAGLIKSRLARRSAEIVSSAIYNGIVPSNGDYVLFYDVEASALNYGFALSVDGDIKVASRHTNDFKTVDTSQIIEAADGASLDKKHSLHAHMVKANETAADFTQGLGDSYLDYMRTLFAGTAYFEGLEKLISNRRNIGNNISAPLSLIKT